MSEFEIPDQMAAKDKYKVALYQAAAKAASLVEDALVNSKYRDPAEIQKVGAALRLLAIVEGKSSIQPESE